MATTFHTLWQDYTPLRLTIKCPNREVTALNKMTHFQIIEDHDNKIIRLGCYFYDFKGVLICEATKEEKETYCCGKYMTYPIVDDSYKVREDREIIDGIKYLITAKKGETIPMHRLAKALDYNVEYRETRYGDVLVNMESLGGIISDYDTKTNKRFPAEITLGIENVYTGYRLDSLDGYYIPERLFSVSEKDGELHQHRWRKGNKEEDDNFKLVDDIVNEICDIMWFFHRTDLYVKIKAMEINKLQDIPSTWPEAILRFEKDVNQAVKALWEEQSQGKECYYEKKLECDTHL